MNNCAAISGVCRAFAGQTGDQPLLRGKRVPRLDGELAGLPATRPQFDPRPFGKRRGANGVEELVRAGELIASVTPAPLAPQPLAVHQPSTG